MVILAALAASLNAVQAPPTPASARAQATASIRIIQGEHFHFARIEREQPYRLRQSSTRLADGSREQLKLVEFE